MKGKSSKKIENSQKKLNNHMGCIRTYFGEIYRLVAVLGKSETVGQSSGRFKYFFTTPTPQISGYRTPEGQSLIATGLLPVTNIS